MKHFAKIDLKSAYNQIEIDDNFKEITTLNTPMGLLRWSRLPCGIKTVCHIFQRGNEKILLGKVDNIIIYQDDICLGARTWEETKSKTEQVLRILKQAGMTINRGKYRLDCEKISYLGYQISTEGICPDERLTNKIAKMEKSTNRKELESFLVLIFTADIFQDIVSLLNHLLKCVKNGEFTWTQKQNKAFEALNKALTSKPVIKMFDPQKEVTLTTDASERAIAVVVSQEDHLIMYLSRKLTSAKCNYSNIEKEDLAIVWCMEIAQNFLLG